MGAIIQYHPKTAALDLSAFRHTLTILRLVPKLKDEMRSAVLREQGKGSPVPKEDLLMLAQNIGQYLLALHNLEKTFDDLIANKKRIQKAMHDAVQLRIHAAKIGVRAGYPKAFVEKVLRFLMNANEARKVIEGKKWGKKDIVRLNKIQAKSLLDAANARSKGLREGALDDFLETLRTEEREIGEADKYLFPILRDQNALYHDLHSHNPVVAQAMQLEQAELHTPVSGAYSKNVRALAAAGLLGLVILSGCSSTPRDSFSNVDREIGAIAGIDTSQRTGWTAHADTVGHVRAAERLAEQGNEAGARAEEAAAVQAEERRVRANTAVTNEKATIDRVIARAPHLNPDQKRDIHNDPGIRRQVETADRLAAAGDQAGANAAVTRAEQMAAERVRVLELQSEIQRGETRVQDYVRNHLTAAAVPNHERLQREVLNNPQVVVKLRVAKEKATAGDQGAAHAAIAEATALVQSLVTTTTHKENLVKETHDGLASDLKSVPGLNGHQRNQLSHNSTYADLATRANEAAENGNAALARSLRQQANVKARELAPLLAQKNAEQVVEAIEKNSELQVRVQKKGHTWGFYVMMAAGMVIVIVITKGIAHVVARRWGRRGTPPNVQAPRDFLDEVLAME